MTMETIRGVDGFRTLRVRLLFWILIVATPIYVGAAWLSYHSTAQRLEDEAIRDADQLAARLAALKDGVVNPIEAGIRTVAFQLEAVDPPRTEYLQRIRGILDAWPDVYGSTIAVEPAGNGRDSAFAPYLFRLKDGKIGYSDLGKDSYGYRHLPWYRVVAESLQPVWSAPYFDAGGGETWMITYSMPFFRKMPRGDRKLAGVVTADLDLEWVRRNAASSSLGAKGMAWLFPSQMDADFIAPVGDSSRRLASFDPQFSLAALRRESNAVFRNDNGLTDLPRSVSQRAGYLVVRHLSTTGWHLALVIPRDQLLAEARRLLDRQILLGIVGLTMLIVAVSLVAEGVTRPIRALATAVGSANADGLDIRLPEKPRRDELGVLIGALRRLRDSLQQHVELRANSLAAQARMDHELEMSAQIQQSMLPRGRSLRSLPAAIHIAVVLQPARQVGGDLYDFFPLHDGQVLFTVGDVSDKGIPAALFMARLAALLRVLGAAGHGPASLLAEINERLAEGNDACMFVTAGSGLLDSSSGRFIYASAGHEPPLLRRLEGDVSVISVRNGTAIGIEAVAEYPQQEAVMAPGDTLVLYTDGVTEAETTDGTLFGIDRLVALLGDVPDGAPQEIIARIVEAVSSHADGFHATDDMTAMAIRFQPTDVVTRVSSQGAGWLIEVECSSVGVERAQRRLRGIVQARHITPGQQHDMELIAEEWLTNVVRAAGKNAARLSIDLALSGTHVILTFRDDCAAFNPLEVSDPDLDAHIVDRPIGGLGIHLLRQIADSCHYTRENECNVLQARFIRGNGLDSISKE